MAAALAYTFTACEPVEDFTENTAVSYTSEQVDVTIEQDGGEGKNNKVTVTVHNDAPAQISNGKQVFKKNSADVILRELGDNTIYVTLFNTDGTTVERQFPVTVSDMPHELPSLITVVWQGEATGAAWEGNAFRFTDVASESPNGTPALSDETYDWMVGKVMSVDFKEVPAGSVFRVTDGWWSTDYGLGDVPLEVGKPFKFKFTQEMADGMKGGAGGKNLMFLCTGGGPLTITRFYYEL